MLPLSIDTNFLDPNSKPLDAPKSCGPKIVDHSKIGWFLAIPQDFSQKKRDFAQAQPKINL